MSSVLASGQPGLVGEDTGFGSFELDALFSGDRPLDAVQQALAVEFLHRSEQIQLERLQCITDGALLAAEQVQDIRLELLEKGPEVSTEAVIFDLFIGLLLDSSLPGKLMKTFANSVSKRMVKRYNLLLEGERRKAAEVLKNPKFMNNLYAREPARSKNIKIIEEMLSKEGVLTGDEYLRAAAKWRNLAEAASNSDVIKNATALMKAGHKASKSRFDSQPLRFDGDTRGVSLLGAVQQFTANARLLNRFQYERMETFIKIGGMSGAQIRDFLRLAEFEPVGSSFKNIRNRCKLLFEGIIWAGLYKFEANRPKLRVKSEMFSSTSTLKGIDERLIDYWLRRFGGEIQRWVGEMGEQARRNAGQDAIADWGKADRTLKLGSLERYFIKLLNGLPRSLTNAKALASSFSGEPGSQ